MRAYSLQTISYILRQWGRGQIISYNLRQWGSVNTNQTSDHLSVSHASPIMVARFVVMWADRSRV